MRLHDLVNDCQAQTRTALELRLEWFEDFFDHLRTHPGTRIRETELPVIAELFNTDRQSSALLHGAHSVFTKVPEALLHAVSIRHNEGLRGHVMTLDYYADLLRFEPVF